MIQTGKSLMLRQAEGQLWASVLATLRIAIIRGELKPNSHLLETELAEMLGVSRGPVREALVRLEHEGLVINVPYRGRFVAEITPKTVREIYDLRRLLESYAAEKAMHNITDLHTAQMQRLATEMMEALAEGEYEKFADLDIEFHRAYVAAADDQRLLQTWETLMGVTHSFIVVNTDAHLLNPDLVASGHEAIIMGIKQRDPNALKDAIRRSLEEGERRVLALMKRQPIES